MTQPNQSRLTLQQKVQAKKDLDAFDGKGESGVLNPCYADGYFMQFIIKKYGMSIELLRKEIKK